MNRRQELAAWALGLAWFGLTFWNYDRSIEIITDWYYELPHPSVIVLAILTIFSLRPRR